MVQASFALWGGPTLRYQITGLDLPPGFSTSHATGLNNLGQVVGSMDTPDGTTHAFLWENGRMMDLGLFGGTESLARDINDRGEISGAFIKDGKMHAFVVQGGRTRDLGVFSHRVWDGLGMTGRGTHASILGVSLSFNDSGQMVGSIQDAADKQSTFLWENGQPSYLGEPEGAFHVSAAAINNQGQIVGIVSWPNKDISADAFLWDNGQFHILGRLGGNYCEATRINDLRIVTGNGLLSGDDFKSAHAFIWRTNVMQDLGTLGGKCSRAYGLNNAGQVVGYTELANGDNVAFVWEQEKMLDLNTLVSPDSGWHLMCATAINDRGQILIHGQYRKREHRVCLLTPTEMLIAVPDSAKARVEPVAQTSTPFNLHSLKRLPNGCFELILRADSTRYLIEASTNLLSWEQLGWATNSNGLIKFVDDSAATNALRFYRAVSP